jgi:hypothetical protein
MRSALAAAAADKCVCISAAKAEARSFRATSEAK